MVGGAGEVRPQDSEWGETLRGASGCPREVAGTAAPKNKRPKVVVPKPPSGKMAKKRWAIALVGGVGEVRPRDSEWHQTWRAASVCQK